MSDKIKAKAQEVRLALLERLGTEVKSSGGLLADRLHELAELTSILNALDPGAGIGSYATSVVPLTDEEIRTMKSA